MAKRKTAKAPTFKTRVAISIDNPIESEGQINDLASVLSEASRMINEYNGLVDVEDARIEHEAHCDSQNGIIYEITMTPIYRLRPQPRVVVESL